MKENSEIVNRLKLRTKPSVPENFFTEFEANLFREIDATPFTLDHLKKNKKPSLPQGYFDGFEPTLEKTGFELNDLQKTQKPELPSAYFTTLEDKLVNTPTLKKFSRLKWLSLVGSVAAALVIFFSVFKDKPTEISPTTATASAEVSDEKINETLLTFLDEEDLIEFIIQNDVAIADSAEIDETEFLDYSTEDIEEFYLELL